MKENELKFIEFVENSSNNYVPKFERIFKSQVLSQLSRHMINELLDNWKLNIDNRFNAKAVCLNCAASMYNLVRNIAKKYFDLKELQKNELKQEEEIEINLLDYSNKKEEIILDLDEKNYENLILSGETIFDENTREMIVVSELTTRVTEEKKRRIY